MNRQQLESFLRKNHKKTPCTITIEARVNPGRKIDFYLAARDYIVSWGEGITDTTHSHKYEFKDVVTVSIQGHNFTRFEIIRNSCKIDSIRINAKTLQELDCRYNKIETINIKGCQNLKSLICSNNNLTEISLINLNKLCNFRCDNNKLTYLDLSSCQNVSVLYCARNNLQKIDMTGCEVLKNIDLSCNDLTTEEINNILNSLPDCALMDYVSKSASPLINLNLNPGYLHCDLTPLRLKNWQIV